MSLYNLGSLLPFAVMLLIFAIGVANTDGNGKSPFMEHGLTMLALGSCVACLGVHGAYFADWLLQEQNARNAWLTTRFPFLRLLGIRVYSLSDSRTWLTRVMTLFLVGFGIMLGAIGLSRL